MHRLLRPARAALSAPAAAVVAGTAVAAAPAAPRCPGRSRRREGPRPGRCSAGAEGPTARSPLRVLVTGFHDWRELGDCPNLWRCRDNPSCRLLLGMPCSSPPVRRDGQLPRLLRQELPEVHFTFQTMTTTWGTSHTLDLLAYDVVVHLGLGVYDSRSKLLLEDGAFNGRAGKDAAGHDAGPTIDMGAGQVCAHERMSGVVQRLSGRRIAGYFDVEVPRARPSNSYICNETHWRALTALRSAERQGDAALTACFFMHIPMPAKESFKSPQHQKAFEERFCDLADDTDYTQLARGVADLVKLLILEGTA